jgi:hypothetical protein
MSRDAVTTVVVVTLVAYGLYIGSYVLPMLVGSPPISILLGFLVQTVAAFAAAVGVWQHRSWAAVALIVLGAAIACTEIVEGFVLGIVAYNRAVAVAVVGLVVTILAAVYVSRTPISRVEVR